MGLSEQEERELERLTKKRQAPDPPPINRSVSFSVDLGKADQVALARKLRLIDDDDDDSGGDSGGGDDGDGDRKPDKAPRRGGYFDK